MKRLGALVLVLAGLCGCLPTHDLAKTLRYADNTPVGVENIKFLDLNQMKRGEACTFNIFYVIPLFGDGSILTAARKGGINNVELIGQTGTWYFPFSTDCTVVYGDKSAIIQRQKEPAK